MIYGINCENNGIVQMINFIRSFNFFWIELDSHELCELEQECFFCRIRSSCLRLRKERVKGPSTIKLCEYVSQLDKYYSVMDWNWYDDSENLSAFIENTLSLILKSEQVSQALVIK